MQRVAQINERSKPNDVLYEVTLRPFTTVRVYAQSKDSARCQAAAWWRCPASLEPNIWVSYVQ